MLIKLLRLSFRLAIFASSLSLAFTPPQHPLDLPRSFKPLSYPKSVAQCSALNREQGHHTDINLHYVDVNPGAKRTMVFVHGWPALWSTWSNQIEQFQNEYHLIIPDLRGFGASTHPGDVQTSGTMADMVSDLACILRHANVRDKVACVGHDWGAQICWEAARMRPDLIGAAVGAVIPYISADVPFMPAKQLASLQSRLSYIIYFETRTIEAAEELNSDIRRTLRAVMRNSASPPPASFLTSPASFLEAWKEFDSIPEIPFLTQEEEDYLVEQYSIQGFDNTLQFYTYGNRLNTWSFDRDQGNYSIPQPALYILPNNDPVADWKLTSNMLKSESFFDQLSTRSMDASHWPHLEKAKEFNFILGEWLADISFI